MPPPSRADLWQAGKDETVEVNQRALIDKILARYSGEHTIFRELLQNADDAGAQHVQVKFYTEAGFAAHEARSPPPALPDAKKAIMTRYVVSNDGIPFRPEDWHRLKKIAEGNPDEEKIGAFGVGFYSLWSVCDDPFVESGNKWMGFYWKDGKDQLLARSGDLPPGSGSASTEPSQTGNPWTTFTMALREPSPLEGPLEFARFLVTSLTFMRTIKRIDMIVDDTKVLEVRKDVTGQVAVARPGLNNTSSMGMMKVLGVDATTMLITSRVMKWLSATGVIPPPLPPAIARPAKAAGGLFASFFGRTPTPTPAPAPTPSPTIPTDPTEVDVLAREIQIYQADIKVTVSKQFGRELERATKKAPPTRMPASLVFSREDEATTTADGKAVADTKRAAAVFAGLCPPLDGEKSAKVFIGQPTGQTTGLGGHLSARFIPTVERESIDLVDRHVSHWNKELLWVGGFLARLIYELELVDLQQQWQKTTSADQAKRAQILARGLHALRFFTFRPTTPSAVVGAEMESAFFQSAKTNSTMPIISTMGVLNVDKVRMPNEKLLEFIPDLPVLTPATVTDASRAVARFRERGLIREPAFDDVVHQLAQRPLNEKEMVACLAWWDSISKMEGYTLPVRNRLLDAAVLVTDSSKVLPLNAVATFINPQGSSIPPDMPLPTDTIPYSVTKGLRSQQMSSTFGWTELTLAHYVHFVVNPPMSNAPGADPETDVRVSPVFAERVLGVLGRGWQSVNSAQQTAIVQTLKEVPLIPTKAGFKKPGESYFEKNLLFDDLPTIALPKTTAIKGGLEKMLLDIGVRRTVDLQLVFSRLIGGGEWSCQDLMKYLVSVKDTLSAEEMARLRQTAAFPLEQPPQYDGSKAAVVRQKPFQLYEPSDAMRELGLPLLDWGEHKWRANSDEARLLFNLGLRRFPPIDTLLGIAAGKSPQNEKALIYLLDNMKTHYVTFNAAAFNSVAFIPATTATGNSTLAKPGEVFSNKDCQILGFPVARPPASYAENAARLRIESDPPMDRLVAAFLAAPETDIFKAKAIFEYLATRVGSSQVASLMPLSNRPFIPVKDGGEKSPTRLARADEVYFTSPNQGQSIYASAFTFIDFGERANFFLKQCGVKAEPSHRDIARLLLRDPEKMLRQAGSASKYQNQLRLLAANVSTFDSGLIRQMRETPFLLASQLVPAKSNSKRGDGEYDREWVLCKASEAAIIDDPTALQYFGKAILAAPEESLLENFYRDLGSKLVSSRITTEVIPTGIQHSSSPEAQATQRHVLERVTIFLTQHATGRKDTDYSVDFLSKGDNFTVREAADIKVRYTYRDHKSVLQHAETLYASATKTRGKMIVLTVSLTASVDFFDIAKALCGILLRNPKLEDSFLLESLLTTPLMSLKKRGYNVDRILNQHKEERLRLQAEAEAAARVTAESSSTAAAKAEAKEANDFKPTPSSAGAITAGGDDLPPAYKPNEGGSNGNHSSIMDLVRNRLGNRSGRSGRTSDEGGSGQAPPSGGVGPVRGQGANSTKRPTNVNDIRNTVHKAVNASRPENSNNINNTKQAVKDVSESQGHYCDESAEAQLRLARNPTNANECKVWLPQDQLRFEVDQADVSLRFAKEILIPLARIFNLTPDVLNVFWDHEGPLIAFNRGGALFCNARYYSAWHDEQVSSGAGRGDALISWYFTLAHELAHNLESAHNASHEFYFSSIAEEFLIPFVRMLDESGA